MILSASRRTDLPDHYADWFFDRLRAGFLYVRNPFRFHQISKIRLSPAVIDCIVFWTKNPENMFPRLHELDPYDYCFQFTLTGYGQDIEPGIPHKRRRMIPVFCTLSDRIGSDRVIWRYDPILFNDVYTPAYHRRAFREIARSLNGRTHRVVISFVDLYAKTKRNMDALALQTPPQKTLLNLAADLAETAAANQMEIYSCAEEIDFQKAGIHHGSCIDKAYLEKIIGCRLDGARDKGQRKECNCLESIDIGSYNTCGNGCRYCYANFSEAQVNTNRQAYDPVSPLLCSTLTEQDRIIERELRSLKIRQRSLFDDFD